MRVLIQRVRYASCKVDGEYTGKIDQGFLMFVGCREATMMPLLLRWPTRHPACGSLRMKTVR